ncbi:hypothetical protein FRC05_007311, partial [Tulasnella sp. 425]
QGYEVSHSHHIPPPSSAAYPNIAQTLDSQSTATTGLNETQALMALPTPPSNNHIPASSLGRKVDDARKAVLSILKVTPHTHPITLVFALINMMQDTGWPVKATQDVQGFIETMETKLNLERIPTDDTQIQGELRIAIEHFLEELESVRGRVKEKSRKYDNKKRGLLEGTTIWFSGVKLGDCTEVLRNCRADVERSLTSLNDHLGRLVINSEQRTSREVQLNSEENAGLIAEGSVGDDSGRLTGTPTVAQPTATPAPDTGLEPLTNAVPSSFTSGQAVSAPADDQQASVATEKKKKSPLRGQLLNAAKIATKVAEGASGLPVVGAYIGVAAKVASTMVEMAQTMDDNDERAERLGTHVCNLSEVLERVSKNSRQPEQSQTKNDIEALQRGLEAVKLEVKTLESQGPLKRFWNSGDQSGNLKNLQEQVRTALEEIQLLVNLNTSILVAELHDESIRNKHGRLLNRLGDGKYGARGNAIEDIICLPGTRAKILESIDNWIRGAGNSERVLWIRGMAGRGKSTIASTVAHNWKGRACCAIYYFRRGQNEPNSPLVCSLARQLGSSLDPELRSAILSTVEKDDNISSHLLDQQFGALFVSSLGPLKQKVYPILIIVDALDECDSVGDAVKFVKLIYQHSSSLPDNLKFLLTSRPEAPLLRALEPRKWHEENLDSIADADSYADVGQFLRHQFSQVKTDRGIEGDWPAQEDISALISMSQGLFQWARTVVKWTSDGSPKYRLKKLLKSPKEAWSGVEKLYTQILSEALEKVKPDPAKENLLLSLLGTLVTAPFPVSLEVITFLHAEHNLVRGESSEAVFSLLREEILVDLNSLLFIPESVAEPIRLNHTSIRDLLVDREGCGHQPYWVDLAKNHRRLASACIRQMNQLLRENVCNLRDLSKSSSEVQDIVERSLSKGIQYCCRSWSVHLTEGKRWSESGAGGVDRHEADFEVFSREKVLCWLEVMSLVGATNEAASTAKQVYHWLS